LRNLHPTPPNSKVLLKKGENNYKGGGTRPKPSKEKTESKNKEKQHHKTDYGNL